MEFIKNGEAVGAAPLPPPYGQPGHFYDFSNSILGYFLTFFSFPLPTEQALFACLVCVSLAAPLSDGDAESIQAFYGFYGNPIYR